MSEAQDADGEKDLSSHLSSEEVERLLKDLPEINDPASQNEYRLFADDVFVVKDIRRFSGKIPKTCRARMECF